MNWYQKTSVTELMVKLHDPAVIGFESVPACDRRTDEGRTDSRTRRL